MECQPTTPLVVSVNGEPRPIPPGSSVQDLVLSLGLDEERVAVEVNRRIVRRAEWSKNILASDAQVEIVQFVGGG